MPTKSANVIPIPGPDNPGRVYLHVVPLIDTGTVLVRPGPSIGRLPKFWPYWLRQLILCKHTGRNRTMSVQLKGNFAYIQSPSGFDVAMNGACKAAGELRAVGSSPVRRLSTYQDMPEWRLADETIVPSRFEGFEIQPKPEYAGELERAKQLAAAVSLPDAARLQIRFAWTSKPVAGYRAIIRLRRRQAGLLSVSELTQMFEMYATLNAYNLAAF